MSVFGYARISTPQQDLERQVRNLIAYDPTIKIYKETYTGRTTQRPKFKQLLARVRSGDTIVFDEVSRMSRDADSGYELYRDLFGRGIDLVFLKERHIDTSIYRQAQASTIAVAKTGNDATDALISDITGALNRYMLAVTREQIRLAFERSQQEVDLLRQRTREGMETARRRGKQIGHVAGTPLVTQKSKDAKPLIRQHSRRYGGTLSAEQCARLCGISRNSYFKYCREIDDELED